MTPSQAAAPATSGATPGSGRSALWVRALTVLPWRLLYGTADLVAWLAWRVFPYRKDVVRENLHIAFPELDEPQLSELTHRYYRGFAQVLMEIVKSASISGEELRRRVHIEGLAPVRELLAGGSPVLLVAAHQCNWEWMLLAFSLELGYPLDAAYKPLVNPWAERELLKVRTRFGSRLVPAQALLADIIRHGRTPRAIALVADQEPRTSEHKHWTRFLNRDTAFYVGTEEIARVTRFPAFFVAMRRTMRGHYAVEVEPLAGRGESLAAGELTERYARRVEQQIRAAPADWPWSHKRWKLRKSLYGRS